MDTDRTGKDGRLGLRRPLLPPRKLIENQRIMKNILDFVSGSELNEKGFRSVYLHVSSSPHPQGGGARP